MTELIQASTALKDVGIAVIVIVGLLVIAYKLIEMYPRWQKQRDEAKEERAKIYARALENLGLQIENQSKQIKIFGDQVEKWGEQVRDSRKLTEKLIDAIENTQKILMEISHREIEHGKVLEVIKERVKIQ